MVRILAAIDNTLKPRSLLASHRSVEGMGRRKTRKVIKREPKRLPKVFRCPRCGEQSVVVDLDRQLSRGKIKCGRCQLSAELPIHALTQMIDVYAKFLDLYYEGKIEETPRESAEKPVEVTRITSPAETRQVTIAAEPAIAQAPEEPETSQPIQTETQKNRLKPAQPAETSQQTN